MLAVLAVQVLLVWWFSAPGRKPLPPAAPPTRFYLAPPTGTTPAPWRLADPTLFALPSQQGFSGPAWLSLVPVQHQVASWTPPPRLLTPMVTLLGEPFRAFARTSQLPTLDVALFSSPQLTRVPAAPLPSAAGSELRLEGDLATRPLLTPVALPSVANSELLENSVVHAVVDAKGWVRLEALQAPSGARRADQLALEITRSLRFHPLPDRSTNGPGSSPAVTLGELVFQWHTLPATNVITRED